MIGQLLIVALLASMVSPLSPITVKGSKFYNGNAQFFIKGVAYQLTNDDPLADANQCALDASLMKTLGANAIRVYHVDPNVTHDACMSTFSDAGIYALIDLDTFDTYINPTTPQWNQYLMSRYSAVMDAFHNYDNVLGFFVGNEVMTDSASSVAAPYVKAAAADMKAYRDSKGYRQIPVGYSAADIADLRPNLQNYMACGGNQSQNLDFFSLNAYEWCGDSSFQQSGYSMLQQNASDYTIPIFFSETGCITVPPRTFGDMSAILGPDMDGTWSGALAYEWIEETNNYGIISYGPPAAATATGAGVVAGFTRTGTPTPISPDFDNLSSEWATLSPTGTSLNAYTPATTTIACPSYTSGAWLVSGDVPLPTIGAALSIPTTSAATSSTTSNTAAISGTTKASQSTETTSQAATAAASATATSGVMGRRDLTPVQRTVVKYVTSVAVFIGFVGAIMGVL